MKPLPFILVLAFGLAALEAETISPQSAPSDSQLIEGKTGDGFQPQPGHPLTYPLSMMDLGAGTIAFWIRLDEPATGAKNLPLVSSGAPPGLWLYVHLNDGKLGFVFQKGQKPFTDLGEFYLNTAVDVSEWQAETWHHVVVSWAENSQEGGLVIAVDGEEREARFNVRLGTGQPLSNLTFGHNSAQIGATPGSVTFDTITVWNVPLSPGQIQEAFTGGSPETEAVVLSAEFEEGWDARSSATLSPDLSHRETLASKLSQ